MTAPRKIHADYDLPPVQLDLVKINGKYWALNPDDADTQLNTEADFAYIGLPYKAEFLGSVNIPANYFDDDGKLITSVS